MTVESAEGGLVVCSSASVHRQYHILSLRQKMEAYQLVRQGDLWF